MAKKKLIRVNMGPGTVVYTPKVSQGSMSFALASPDLVEKDGVRHRTQISSFVTCRDQLCYVPYYAINGGQIGDIYKKKNGMVDIDQLRLIMGTRAGAYENIDDAEIKKRVFSAKRAINLIEAHGGWTPSTITTVIHDKITDGQVWLFTGEKRWIKAPQMLSLCALIFRLARRNGVYNTDSLEDFITDALEKAGRKNKCGTADTDYVKTVFPHLKHFIEAYDNVFEGDQAQYYPKNAEKGMGESGGIYGLFRKETGNAALHKRLQHHVLNKKK